MHNSGMRDLLSIVEGSGSRSGLADMNSLTMADVPDGLKPRFRDFTAADFEEVADKYEDAASFAGRFALEGTQAGERAHAVLVRCWFEWNDQGKLERRRTERQSGLSGLHGLKAYLANALGAVAYKPAHQPEWGHDYIGSPTGYILATATDRIFLDAEVMPAEREVWMSEISVEKKGSGTGTAVVEALRAYAASKGYGVVVWKVANHRFFARFDWLVADGDYNDTSYHSTFGPRPASRDRPP